MQESSSWLLVERPDGSIDKVCTSSLSFDGGSLICFADASQTKVKAAYSPVGWAHVRWCSRDEIPTQ
ncbi:hypothetical protein CKF74_07190 [Corynebacterium striatum]|nr:hypothetical protein CKF74_07190 [Corynebacterium striatum]